MIFFFPSIRAIEQIFRYAFGLFSFHQNSIVKSNANVFINVSKLRRYSGNNVIMYLKKAIFTVTIIKLK